MPDDEADPKGLQPAKKRKRQDESPPPSHDRRHNHSDNDNDTNNDDLPQPYDAQALQPAKKRALSPADQTGSGSGGARKQKRPGARARISEAQREAARRRHLERERDSAAAEAAAAEQRRLRGINDVVRQHYNNVPERGRDWRKKDSRIKGLRSFNNWIKSCIIQKFSPDEDHVPGSREQGISSDSRLLVLDMGCGKGGDLGKWQQSPQPVDLYVGIDPADVSISQARDRFRSMTGGRGGGGGGQHHRRPHPRPFEAQFYVKDCFGEPIEQLEIIRRVGFADPPNINRAGFDVVSIMFAMHYAFETPEKARMMLRNVSASLKKGGRFIGCIPNSDVIGERVRQWNAKRAARKSGGGDDDDDDDNKNDYKNSNKSKEESEEGELEEDEAQPTAEWGNSIYRVRFPGPTPDDGIFRPAFGWKYNFFLDEAVEEVPEYVVPWEAFRGLAEDFNLELQYHKNFMDVWAAEKDDPVLGPLSERMGVRARGGGELAVTPEEQEVAGFYVAFCFYKV